MTLTLTYPPSKQRAEFFRRFGLNAYYSGKHWAQRKADADEWHWTVKAALAQQRVPKHICERPVEIIFRWNDRLDCDNHAVMGKYVVDALKGWVIQDDDRRYVRRVTHEFWTEDAIQVVVKEMAP